MPAVIFLISGMLLLLFAYLVLYHVVARDYLNNGQLGWMAATLQLSVFIGFFCIPYIYLPLDWAWDWLPNGTWNRLVALILVCLGMIAAFGTMIWFGVRRAFGLTVKGLVKSGPYRYSRNPQVLGGWMMVFGVFMYQPSLYTLGWMIIWAVIIHWMVINEEIHLRRQYGEEFERYCAGTPRYFFRW